MTSTKSVHVVITGTVQGVFYRKWTQERALARGVAGWVRNREDGAVEGVFSGRVQAVDALLAECRLGPAAARVADIAVEEAEPLATRGFAITD